MSYFDDTDPALLPHEEVIGAGFTYHPSLECLSHQLLKAILKDGPYHARLRAVTNEAVRREPGTPVKDLFDLGKLTFRSPQRVMQIDAALHPFYGHVTPAMNSLHALGIERPITDFWLEYFMKDNAIYRVNVTACVVIAGALMYTEDATRIGTPTKLATLQRVH